MKFLSYTDSYFAKIKLLWEGKNTLSSLSVLLVLIFIVSSLTSLLVMNDFVHLGKFNSHFRNPFFSIEIVFTLLLIMELFGLIFILPKSVAKSVGKQFEILSLIFLRDGFKEFSHIGSELSWTTLREPFTIMMVYSFGAIAVFSIIGYTHKLQKHIKLTNVEDDQEQFVSLKKLLALLLLVAFVCVGYFDLKALFFSGSYLHSFHTFYTVLIFSDILIVLIALRYTLNYYRIFRYSSFVLATILIRISLSVEPYYDVLIGIIAAVFILALTMAYNYFLKDFSEKKRKEA